MVKVLPGLLWGFPSQTYSDHTTNLTSVHYQLPIIPLFMLALICLFPTLMCHYLNLICLFMNLTCPFPNLTCPFLNHCYTINLTSTILTTCRIIPTTYQNHIIPCLI